MLESSVLVSTTAWSLGLGHEILVLLTSMLLTVYSGVHAKRRRSGVLYVIISSSRTSNYVVRMQIADGCIATSDCEVNTHNSEVINSPICDGELAAGLMRWAWWLMLLMITMATLECKAKPRLQVSHDHRGLWTRCTDVIYSYPCLYRTINKDSITVYPIRYNFSLDVRMLILPGAKHRIIQ